MLDEFGVQVKNQAARLIDDSQVRVSGALRAPGAGGWNAAAQARHGIQPGLQAVLEIARCLVDAAEFSHRRILRIHFADRFRQRLLDGRHHLTVRRIVA